MCIIDIRPGSLGSLRSPVSLAYGHQDSGKQEKGINGRRTGSGRLGGD